MGPSIERNENIYVFTSKYWKEKGKFGIYGGPKTDLFVENFNTYWIDDPLMVLFEVECLSFHEVMYRINKYLTWLLPERTTIESRVMQIHFQLYEVSSENLISVVKAVVDGHEGELKAVTQLYSSHKWPCD